MAIKKADKKNLVIFDGSNFYHYAKRLSPRTHLTDFNYLKLVEQITGSNKNHAEYCVGEIKKDRHDNDRTVRLYANQQALFYNLEKQGIIVKKGYILRSGFTYHEKGVDVRIALDILRGALRDEYDKCFIISSDTDILPAIIDAKAEGKEIIYVGFEGNVSRAMCNNCSKTVLISKKLIKEYGR